MPRLPSGTAGERRRHARRAPEPAELRCGVRRLRGRNHSAVPSTRRSARVLPHVLFGAGAGRGVTELTAVAWDGDAVVYLDQRLLPDEVRYVRARSVEEIEGAIASLAVRGAPCIGVFGAFGVALLRRSIDDDAAFVLAAART